VLRAYFGLEQGQEYGFGDLPGRSRDGGIGEHSGERSTRVPIKGGISEIGGRDGYCQ
jgi:hypothetical protein